MKVYQQIASSFSAMLDCEKSGNVDWYERHEETINDIVKKFLPHGSGFDCGTQFDFVYSKPEKLIFITHFHHMDENGFYDGWSDDIKVIVTPSLVFGFNLKITGIRRKNRNDEDFFYDTFYNALNQEVDK